jgi:membrane protease YdiL (CAAX protease family)
VQNIASTVLILVFGLFLFVALPVVAARTNAHKPLVAALLLAIGVATFIFFLATPRLIWGNAPEGEPGRTEFMRGVAHTMSVARPIGFLFLGPMVGLALLGILPKRSKTQVPPRDAA